MKTQRNEVCFTALLLVKSQPACCVVQRLLYCRAGIADDEPAYVMHTNKKTNTVFSFPCVILVDVVFVVCVYVNTHTKIK